ncbi:FIST signal transduction protein [Veronia pacifica]|uniref:Histidine kinase n=1 Tax=Veronia pacifica TaxID=1080227 RepID=A0A1C3EEX0_9GAMM|nr:FIST N-terminal domain-containing protein [Veronia pacifica]ODA31744.1 hypothetical protein A8L45_15300 [Veronia pacifica]
MKIATAFSSDKCSRTAVSRIVESLCETIVSPSLLVVYHTEETDIVVIRQQLGMCYPDAQIIGCSSCQGLITESGYIDGQTVAVWALEDPEGAYGSAVLHFGHGQSDAAEVTKAALIQAIENSDRPGELPELIVLHATPGCEEDILESIVEELGVSVPIIGGTAADNHLDGNWSVFDNEHETCNGLGIAVFYPSVRTSYAFNSGFSTVGFEAKVTKVDGREVVELDHRPAADVYREWYREITRKEIHDESIFKQSTLFPLGRQTGTIHGIPYFALSHPSAVSERGGIEMFTNIDVGETVYLMSGTRQMLVTRAGRVLRSACGYKENNVKPIGGLAIYCAGCMLLIKDQLHEVASQMHKTMKGSPFACAFTFGEQGQFLCGELAHGNLMISAVVFHEDRV